MTTERPYTDQDVATAVAALQRRSTVPAESGYHAPTPAQMDAWLADRARPVLDALTADGWHRGGRCLQLTAEHMQAAEDTADVPRSVEESKARLAETLRPLGWAPVAETRAEVAEEIARALTGQAAREHPGSVDQVVMLAAAEIARERATRPAPTEEPTDG